MKVYIQKLWVAIAALCVSASASAFDFKVDNIYYNKISNTAVEVTYKENHNASYSGTVNIPSQVAYEGNTYSVTTIGYRAFFGCEDVTAVTIPTTVTKINSDAFRNCEGLTSLNLPTSVTSIGTSAFFGCRNVSSLTIPNSVHTIGGGAFYNCNGLKLLVIPSSVSYISDAAFYSCKGLESIYCQKTTPPSVGSYRFSTYTYSNATLYVPKGSKSAYNNTTSPWSNFENIVEGEYNGVDDVIVDGANREVVGYYNMQGIMSSEPWSGLNIVVYSDGSHSKIVHKQ